MPKPSDAEIAASRNSFFRLFEQATNICITAKDGFSDIAEDDRLTAFGATNFAEYLKYLKGLGLVNDDQARNLGDLSAIEKDPKFFHHFLFKFNELRAGEAATKGQDVKLLDLTRLRQGDLDLKGATAGVYYAETQGIRPSQEDAFIIGAARVGDGWDDRTKIPALLKRQFEDLGERLRGTAEASGRGSTAIVAHYSKDQTLTIANAGDARAVLFIKRPDGTFTWKRLTNDHEPDDVLEEARIKKDGGRITYTDAWGREDLPRVDGDLNIGRSLGDTRIQSATGKHLISFESDIFQYDVAKILREARGDQCFLVTSCDGLYDHEASNEATYAGLLQTWSAVGGDGVALRRRYGNNIAEYLKDCAIALGSTDNVTVCVSDVTRPPAQATITGVFDGHGGAQVSSTAAVVLGEAFIDQSRGGEKIIHPVEGASLITLPPKAAAPKKSPVPPPPPPPPPRKPAGARVAVDDFNAFNIVSDRSLLTHQNVLSLLSASFSKAGKSAAEIDVMNTNGTLHVCPIGGDIDEPLRDAILQFIGQTPPQDKASIALIDGRVNQRTHLIEGGSHWTALHLRRAANGSIQAYYMDSMNGAVPAAVTRVLGRIGSREIGNLNADLQAQRIYQEAGGRILTDEVRLQMPIATINCERQRDGYSCGYHSVFNLLRIHDAPNPAAPIATATQDSRQMNVADFIAARKADLMREFPSRRPRFVEASSKISLRDEIADIVFSEALHLTKLKELLKIETNTLRRVATELEKVAKDSSKDDIKELEELEELTGYYRIVVGNCLADSRFRVTYYGSKLSDEAESFLGNLSSAKACADPKKIISVLTAITQTPENLLDVNFIAKESEKLNNILGLSGPKTPLITPVPPRTPPVIVAAEEDKGGAPKPQKPAVVTPAPEARDQQKQRILRDVEFFGEVVPRPEEKKPAHKLETGDGKAYVVEGGQIAELDSVGNSNPVPEAELSGVLVELEQKMKSVEEKKIGEEGNLLRDQNKKIIQASDGSIKFKVTTPLDRKPKREDAKKVSIKWETLEKDDDRWSLQSDKIEMNDDQEKTFRDDIMKFYKDKSKTLEGIKSGAQKTDIPSTTIKLITAKALRVVERKKGGDGVVC